MTTASKATKRSGGWSGLGEGFGWNGDGSGRERPMGTPPPDVHRLGMWFALCAITMMFIGLTSAYVVRQGIDPEWRPIHMPALLWLNTAVLAISSFTIELARAALGVGVDGRRGWLLRTIPVDGFTRWVAATLVLGLAFLGGQAVAWRQVAGQGLYLATYPHSSFFYLLTGLHGLHVAGGVAALTWLFARGANFSPLRRRRWTEATALYWHFVAGLWIYLLALLFVRR